MSMNPFASAGSMPPTTNPFDPFAGAPQDGHGGPNPYEGGAAFAGGMDPQTQQYQPQQQAYGMPGQQQQQLMPPQQQQQQQQLQYQNNNAQAGLTQDPWGSQHQAAQTPQQQQYPGVQQPGSAPMQDPWGTEKQQAPMQQQQQFPGQQVAAPAPTPAQDPWGTPAPAPAQIQQQPPGQGFGQQVYEQQSQQFPGPTPATNGYDPFSAQSNQLVVSQQQTNPYTSMVTGPQPGQNYGSQSMVPAVQNASTWGMPQAPAYGKENSSSYDPFAAPPAPVPVPAPAQPSQIVPVYAQPNVSNDNPFGDAFPPPPAPAAPPPAQAPAQAPAPLPVDPEALASQERQLQRFQKGDHGEHRHNNSESRAIVPVGPPEARNPYASELARRAPPGASPLPKAELVGKKGYVLSRISFRTIVMKKWKQSFWVQYGSHTMLWFRSEGDFDDWLNNPYHTQAQRNFLIKLAVNFVHDLYKPNVRGYQVTQCRVKPYGNKMVRQFKLERWMDYGPTIAAAFGAYEPREVDALRAAIVECMRNTPLDSGIRATGAVRQMPDSHNNGEPITRPARRYSHHDAESPYRNDDAAKNRASSAASAYTQPTPSSNQAPRVAVKSRSVVSAADLLDDQNHFDETASLPPGGGALVPASFPPQVYPGAPSQSQYFQGPGGQQYPPPQQQQLPYGAYQQPPAAYPQPPQGYHQAPPPNPHQQQLYYQQPQQQFGHQQQQQFGQQQQQQQYGGYPGQGSHY